MKPFRLFVVLVLMAGTALSVVYYRVASVRVAYRVQTLHKRQNALQYRLWDQQAEIAKLSEPAKVETLIRKEQIPVRPPHLPPPGPGGREAAHDWETD